MKRGTLSSSQTIESTVMENVIIQPVIMPMLSFQPGDKNQRIGECCHAASNNNIYVTIQPDGTHLRIHILDFGTEDFH